MSRAILFSSLMAIAYGPTIRAQTQPASPQSLAAPRLVQRPQESNLRWPPSSPIWRGRETFRGIPHPTDM